MSYESGAAASRESGRRYLEDVYGHEALLKSGEPVYRKTASKAKSVPVTSRESGKRI